MTVMTHVKALQAGHSSQGRSEPITPASVFLSGADGCAAVPGAASPADLAGVVAVDVTSLAAAGMVTVGVADLADAGMALPADLAGVVAADVATLAAAGVVTVGVASLADAGSDTVGVSELADAGMVTVGVVSLADAGMAFPAVGVLGRSCWDGHRRCGFSCRFC